MKSSAKVVFDISQEKFKYLQRDDFRRSRKVDMNELNKRLNQNRKINLYNNTKIVAFSLLLLGFFILISLNY
tara:strand:- start:70 stop:285 length:216 start_codon:yes stop_codon:yes gene_type:complete